MAAGDKDGASTPATANAAAAPASPAEARVEDELQQLRDLLIAQQEQSQEQTEELKKQLKEQQEKVQSLQDRLNDQVNDQLNASGAAAANSVATSRGAQTPPSVHHSATYRAQLR